MPAPRRAARPELQGLKTDLAERVAEREQSYGVGTRGDIAHLPWLRGLKIMAGAVVAQAVWAMTRNPCPARLRASAAIAAALLALGGCHRRSVRLVKEQLCQTKMRMP